MNRQRESRASGWHRLVSFLFARKGKTQVVETRAYFDASPEEVWNRIMFYEEVPGPPPFLLRLLLPIPMRTLGEKGRLGALVQCTYRGGDLTKRITVAEAPNLLRFEVAEQRLGIEDWVLALGGSYEIRRHRGGAEVVLTTSYKACLGPRFVWRPVENFLAGQLHRHILGGISAALRDCLPATHSTIKGRGISEATVSGGLACKAAQSDSRR